MDITELDKEINRGKELFTEVFRFTSDFLERMPAQGPIEISEFEGRRKRLLSVLIKFVSSFNQKISIESGRLDLSMTKKLEEFKIFQEVFVQIIMEKNRAIISLAKQEMERLRAESDAVGKCRQAISGYGKIRGITTDSFDQTA